MSRGIIARIGGFFLGCDTVLIEDDKELNALEGFFYAAKRTEGGWELSMSSADRAAAEMILSERGAAYRVICRTGLPSLCRRFSRRPGVPVGIALACVLAAALSRFVWTIDVIPREEQERDTETEQALLDGVRALGCTEGAFIPSLDLFGICSDYLAQNKDICWMSIDISGTAAQIRYQRTAYRDGKIDESMPSNVIASREGVVEYVNTGAGEAMVGDGDNIEKGQLLISGALENAKTGASRYTHARGNVIAHTQHILVAEEPLTVQDREYGDVKKTVCVSVFGGRFCLFRHTPREGSAYEQEHTSRRLTFPGNVILPVTVETDSYYYYTAAPKERTVEEAARAAEARMRVMLQEEIGEGEIISRSDEGELVSRAEGDVYILKTTIHCLEDIAEVVPLAVIEMP